MESQVRICFRIENRIFVFMQIFRFMCGLCVTCVFACIAALYFYLSVFGDLVES